MRRRMRWLRGSSRIGEVARPPAVAAVLVAGSAVVAEISSAGNPVAAVAAVVVAPVAVDNSRENSSRGSSCSSSARTNFGTVPTESNCRMFPGNLWAVVRCCSARRRRRRAGWLGTASEVRLSDRLAADSAVAAARRSRTPGGSLPL